MSVHVERRVGGEGSGGKGEGGGAREREGERGEGERTLSGGNVVGVR